MYCILLGSNHALNNLKQFSHSATVQAMHTNMFKKTYKMFTKVCHFVQQDTARRIPNINVSTHSLSLHSDNNLSGYEVSLKQAQKFKKRA